MLVQHPQRLRRWPDAPARGRLFSPTLDALRVLAYVPTVKGLRPLLPERSEDVLYGLPSEGGSLGENIEVAVNAGSVLRSWCRAVSQTSTLSSESAGEPLLAQQLNAFGQGLGS
jgi:hypothetical protein